MHMKRIFVMGSMNMDIVFEVEGLPKNGETINAKDLLVNPGGKEQTKQLLQLNKT